MTRVGIAGGAGYTGGELLRLLVWHPGVEIVFVHSKSQAGRPVAAVHQDLFGDCTLEFTDTLSAQIDVLFLCLGHGDSKDFLEQHPQPDQVKIIDLSQDFRLERDTHSFVYGLPELNLTALRKAQKIANPGCFATAIQLALLPLAQAQRLEGDIHIQATTGSTGAGQSPSPTTHFSWRSNNLSVYKAFTHQHLHEIEESLGGLQAELPPLHFIPQRGNFSRGILATVSLRSTHSLSQNQQLYRDYYAEHPFTWLVPHELALKQVVNTNKCFIQLIQSGEQLLIVSALDNLIKGASGQAVQNMNLACGYDQTLGLHLKPIGL